MVNGLPPQQANFLVEIGRTQARAAAAQQQITSGYRVRSAGDDPEAVDALLHAQSALAGLDQTKKNMTLIKAQVEAGSAAVQASVRLMDEALTTGMQAGGVDVSPERRKIVAAQLTDVLTRMVNLANTSANGRYVFSGDLDGSPTYRLNLGSPNGVDRLADPSATIQIAHPDGSRISIGRTAQELFDLRDSSGAASPSNVFAALQNLRQAVESGTNAEVGAALEQVKAASAHLNTQGAAYGATLNRVDSALNDSDAGQAQWKIRLSEIRDADVASAILEMQHMQTQLTASMSAQAQSPRTSLFDFLR